MVSLPTVTGLTWFCLRWQRVLLLCGQRITPQVSRCWSHESHPQNNTLIPFESLKTDRYLVEWSLINSKNISRIYLTFIEWGWARYTLGAYDFCFSHLISDSSRRSRWARFYFILGISRTDLRSKGKHDMKNYAAWGGLYPPSPKSEMDNSFHFCIWKSNFFKTVLRPYHRSSVLSPVTNPLPWTINSLWFSHFSQ